jgi:hypothetical protein
MAINRIIMNNRRATEIDEQMMTNRLVENLCRDETINHAVQIVEEG